MRYEHFFNMLEACQTPRIRAVSFPSSCSPENIPDHFAACLPDIIATLNAKINFLCKENEMIVVFGLQPVSCALASSAPYKLNRICDQAHPELHFCCTISYLVLPKDNTDQITSWSNAQTVVIDFTTGKLMSAEHYLFALFKDGIRGRVYGRLSRNKLRQIWKTICAGWLAANAMGSRYSIKQKLLTA